MADMFPALLGCRHLVAEVVASLAANRRVCLSAVMLVSAAGATPGCVWYESHYSERITTWVVRLPDAGTDGGVDAGAASSDAGVPVMMTNDSGVDAAAPSDAAVPGNAGADADVIRDAATDAVLDANTSDSESDADPAPPNADAAADEGGVPEAGVGDAAP